MRRFLARLMNLLRFRRPYHKLSREIDAHLVLLQDTYEARGLAPDAARRAARLTLGNIEHVKEQHRDARSFRWIEDLWQDAGHGLRRLRPCPSLPRPRPCRWPLASAPTPRSSRSPMACSSVLRPASVTRPHSSTSARLGEMAV